MVWLIKYADKCIWYKFKGFWKQKWYISICTETSFESSLIVVFISYTDTKNNYPIQVIDQKFQLDYINPLKVQPIEEYNGATINARLFMVLFRHNEVEMKSDGKKITQANII